MSWTTLATPPFIVGGAVTDGTTVWVIEDVDVGFSSYDPATDTYTPLADSPFVRGVDEGVVVYDPAGPAVWVLSDGWGNTVHTPARYDIGLDSWSTSYTQHPTAALRSVAETAWGLRPGNREVVMAGGYLHSSPFITAETWSYNLDTDTWTQLADMPHVLAEMQAVWIDDGFIVFGAWDDDIGVGDYFPESYAYDPIGDAWSTLPAPDYSGSTAGYPVVVRLSTGLVVVLGGYGDSQSAAVWVWDPDTLTWSNTQPDAPFDGYMQGVVVDDVVYVWETYDTHDAASLDLSAFVPPAPPASGSYIARYFAEGNYPAGPGTTLTALVVDWEDPVEDVGKATVVLRADDPMVDTIGPDDYIAIYATDFDGNIVGEVCNPMIVDSDALISKDPDEEIAQTATYTGPLLIAELGDGPIEPPLGDGSFPVVDDVHFDDSHPAFDWSGYGNAIDVMDVYDAKRNALGDRANQEQPDGTSVQDGVWGYLQAWAWEFHDTDEYGNRLKIIGPSDSTPVGNTTSPGNTDFGGVSFTTSFTGLHAVFWGGDNTLQVFLDGAEIGSAGTGGNPPTSAFLHMSVEMVYLTAGEHFPVIRGVNWPAPIGAPNPMGDLMEVWIPGNPFDPANLPHLVWSSTAAMKAIEHWTISPGMSPGMVFRLWLEGEQARGRLTDWSYSMPDDDHDSAGESWSTPYPTLSFRVGQDDGLSLSLKIMEAYADVRVDLGTKQVSMFNKSTMTAASGVTFDDGNLTSLHFERVRIKADEFLNRSQFGWTRVNAGGKRVGSFTFGPEDNLDEIARLESALLAITSVPRDSTSFTYKPRDDSELPTVNPDFVKGNTATVPTRPVGGVYGSTTDRIMSLGGRWSKESETCIVRVTVKDVLLQDAERILRSLKALGA